ncbi:MAG: prefoldin subunit alpha [Candidatus Marsarchaeota archaeon]|nr:prefoldin subunit alpha [Candidatus Marsarchaeota archaeon]MCL5095065.1 prefoldin subunit alpha [Candidatus Marsarchaeota archaeon]
MSSNENNMHDGDINDLIEKSKSHEQLQYLYNIYETQYNETIQNINNYSKIITELLNSIKILENNESIGNNDVFINMGNSIYANAKIEKMDKILVDAGSHYILEKNIDEAKAFINLKLKKFEKTIEIFNKNKTEIRDILFKISYKLSMISVDQNHKH